MQGWKIRGGEDRHMCYNCGCQDPMADMGHADTITEQTFEKAAKASSQTIEQAKESTYELLKQQLGK